MHSRRKSSAGAWGELALGAKVLCLAASSKLVQHRIAMQSTSSVKASRAVFTVYPPAPSAGTSTAHVLSGVTTCLTAAQTRCAPVY